MGSADIYDILSLINAINNDFQPIYLFFWGHQARKNALIGKRCLSHWWPSSFEVENVAYPTMEHFLMAEKARLFGDEEARKQILLSSKPGEAKTLGRSVRNFREDIWTAHRSAIAIMGNQAKFTQNETLRDFLLATKEKILVEASPVDHVWGIGLAEDDIRARDPTQWRGLNLLGFALMEVRSRLQQSHARDR